MSLSESLYKEIILKESVVEEAAETEIAQEEEILESQIDAALSELDNILESDWLKKNEDKFGEIKIEKPSNEGLAAGIAAADQFVEAKDGQADDIDLSFHDAFKDIEEGLEEDADLLSGFNEEAEVDSPIDPGTIPAFPEEQDQITVEEPKDPEMIGGEMPEAEEAPTGEETVSDAELAADDAEMEELDDLDESFTGWDDLF